jgi:hypothetical protein
VPCRFIGLRVARTDGKEGPRRCWAVLHAGEPVADEVIDSTYRPSAFLLGGMRLWGRRDAGTRCRSCQALISPSDRRLGLYEMRDHLCEECLRRELKPQRDAPAQTGFLAYSSIKIGMRTAPDFGERFGSQTFPIVTPPTPATVVMVCESAPM